MPTIKLTDKTVTAAKAPESGRLELWDEQTPGLCLRVSDSGKKVWVWRYRTLDGRQPRLSLGDYSTKHSLKWAREQVESLRVQVRGGTDPAAERREAKAAARAQTLRTFDDLADAYLKACESGEWKPKGKVKRARTLADERGSLRRHIRPAMGKREVDSIKRADVRKFLQGMACRGIGAQTNKAHQVIRQCFAYAIAEERVEINPATGFAKAAAVVARTRTLSDAELKDVWQALENPSDMTIPAKGKAPERPLYIGRPMRIAIQLSALLLQRRAEVAGMMRAEVDLAQGTWLIPADRMKNGYPHLVPLPAKALELVKEAIKLATERRTAESEKPVPNDWPLFPSPANLEKAVRPDSLTHALVDLVAALRLPNATPHDLRRTGSTALTSERLGVSPFIRSKVLGHRGDTGGGSAVSAAHYDTNSYAAEKRKALAAWEGLLLEITEESSP